jgi:capsule polysaccharide export protein KpsE/RkpR
MMQKKTWAKLIVTALVILMYAYFTFWAAPRYQKISEGEKLLDTSPVFT